MKYAASMTELTSQLILVFSQLVRSTAGEREEILERYIEPSKPLTALADFLEGLHGAYFQGGSLPDNDLAPSPKYYESRSGSLTIRFDSAIYGSKDTSLVMTWNQAARFISEHKEIFISQNEIPAEQNEKISIGQHHDLLVGILRKTITDQEKKQELINLCKENRGEDVLKWVSYNDNIYDNFDITIGEKDYDIEFYSDNIEILYSDDFDRENVITELSYKQFVDFILENYKEIFGLTDQTEPPAAAENPNKTITYIPIGHLEPHPKNPRKDVGDISELADSIRKNGIMQNLTVVPWFPANPSEPKQLDGYYRILIGHRRYEAARAAGLEVLPCVIAEGLSMKEQVGIMLAENMQRADLTEPEQAEGFQLMLDLGDTVSSISETTGFSESTIRRRLKMSQYDMEQVKKSYNEGMRLEDFEELEQINDPAVREKLVENYKPNNFRMELESAIRKQEKEIWFENAEKVLSEFAEKLPQADYTAYHFIRTVSVDSKLEKIKEIIDFDENKKYYYVNTGYGIDIYTDREKQQESRPQVIQKPHENVAELRELCATMKKMRKDFIKNFKAFPCKKATEILEKIYAIFNLLMENYYDLYVGNIYSIADITGFEFDEDMSYKEFIERSSTKDLRGLVILAYSMLPGDGQLPFDSFTAEYRENKVGELRLHYEFLEICGYAISDEERAVLDGTHRLYVKGDSQ